MSPDTLYRNGYPIINNNGPLQGPIFVNVGPAPSRGALPINQLRCVALGGAGPCGPFPPSPPFTSDNASYLRWKGTHVGVWGLTPSKGGVGALPH